MTHTLTEPLVQAIGLSCGYREGPVVRDLDLSVHPGEVVALLGPNGAGKTTTLRTLAGDLPRLGGTILVDGTDRAAALHRRARSGLSFVTEERSIFADLTTAENLRVGRCNETYAVELFPELRDRLRVRAGALSGGEQQMLSLARALARSPRLLFADELSLGLAPLVVDRLLTVIADTARQHGVGVLLVEQHISRVLEIADRVYVLGRGRVELTGSAQELRTQLTAVESAYFGGRDE